MPKKEKPKEQPQDDENKNSKSKEGIEWKSDDIFSGPSETVISMPLSGYTIASGSISSFLTDDVDKSLSHFRTTSFDRYYQLQTEIAALKGQLRTTADELHDEKKNRKQVEAEYGKIKENLVKKERLEIVSGRIHERAIEKLFTSDTFVQKFTKDSYQEVVVLSIDIRRSTELMLKAKTPALFATFITSLCGKLVTSIITNYGVFDKFTGDGILAFFPAFYSGRNAILFAVKAAQECHKLFKDHYRDYRYCFSTVLKEIGLGIGIDSGKACITIVNNDLTVVGEPVVYACRFSSCERDKTVLNQTAMEKMHRDFGRFCKIDECDVNIKNEGKTVAYTVEVDFNAIQYKPPTWDRE